MPKSPAKRALKRWRAFTQELVDVTAQGATREHLAELRRQRTRHDPALFALVYLSRHLADPQGQVALADVHAEWADDARSWATPPTEPYADRRAEVAPREMGKSTWWFLILPMWAAAHGHARFAAAFADTEQQAQTHLATFKSELDNNALIRHDFPDLVAPKTRGRGTVEADRVSLYHARSGFVFSATGMDSSNLGMKVGAQRPDLIVLDDIEPHEGRYSAALAEKRLDTLRSAILPLNVYARVALVGTVTMSGSLVHQIVRYSRGERDAKDAAASNAWVGEEKIRGRQTMPILPDGKGGRRSVWPSKWPLAFLESIEHTRQYAKNYANDPLAIDGDYWTMDDFVRAPLDGTTRVGLWVDPAVTTKKSSDFTGVAVVAWRPPEPGTPGAGKCVVRHASQVKMPPDELRLYVLRLVQQLGVGAIFVEGNQGGELWARIFWGMGVKVKVYPAGSAAKEVRAADALDHYQRGRVLHDPAADLRDAEGQMVAFPNAPHDDMVDAVGAGVRYFLSRKRGTGRVGGVSASYAA